MDIVQQGSARPTTEVRSEATLRFWRHIFGGERGLLQVWTGKRVNGEISKASIVSNNFNYPKTAKEAAIWALEKSDEGREVYFCTHLLTGPRRIKENAAAVRTLWGDLDGAAVPNGEIEPTATLESSPGRHHCYWRLTDPIPPEKAEQLNRRLAHEIGADPSGFDLSQLLRVPGTVNHKYEDKPGVRIFELERGRSYTAAELEEILPHLEELRAEYEPEAEGDEPPVRLDSEALKVWRGEVPKFKESGELDRSATLMHIGRVVFDVGGNRAVVVADLRERDRALGYNKYSSNRDGGQREYERIFEKLRAEGRSQRVRVNPNSANSANSAKEGVEEEPWAPPAAFHSLALPEFPRGIFPAWMSDYIEALAKATQTPRDLAGMLGVTVGAVASAKLVEVEVWDGWKEPTNLFTATAMKSGSRKTTVFERVCAPVEEYEASLIEKKAPEIAEQRTKYRVYEARLKKAE